MSVRLHSRELMRRQALVHAALVACTLAGCRDAATAPAAPVPGNWTVDLVATTDAWSCEVQGSLLAIPGDDSPHDAVLSGGTAACSAGMAWPPELAARVWQDGRRIAIQVSYSGGGPTFLALQGTIAGDAMTGWVEDLLCDPNDGLCQEVEFEGTWSAAR